MPKDIEGFFSFLPFSFSALSACNSRWYSSSVSGLEMCIRDRFGSYGWGDGEWMRNWEERAKNDGATLVGGEGLIVNETPDNEALEKCAALGAELVKE